MYPIEKLREEIHSIMEKPECKDKDRLKIILNSFGSNDLSGIRNKMVDVAIPHKNALIKLWKKDFKDNRENSLASFIGDYEALFIKDHVA